MAVAYRWIDKRTKKKESGNGQSFVHVCVFSIIHVCFYVCIFLCPTIIKHV